MADSTDRLRKAKGQLEALVQSVKATRAAREEHDSQRVFLKTADKYMFPDLPRPTQIACRKTLRGHFGKVYAMQWGGVSASPYNDHPDGISNELVSVGQDGKMIIWNALTTLKYQSISLDSTWIMTCAFEPTEGRQVASAGLDNTISIFSVGEDEEDEPQQQLKGHTGYVSCCRFLSPAEILSCSGDKTIRLWDIQTEQEKSKFEGHKEDVMQVSMCPVDPNVFVSGACDNTAKIWDVRVGAATHTFHACKSDVNSVQYLGNGNAFVVGSDDSTCKVFDIRSFAEFNSFNDIDTVCGITSVDVSKSGRLLFAGYDDFNCFVWDITRPPENAKIYSLQDHENRVSCLGLDATGKALGTGSWDCLLKVFA